jgi:heme exporter protein B
MSDKILTRSEAPSRKAGSSSSWRQYKAILRKDIVMELRTKEMLTSMGLYTLLTLVVYYVALSQTGNAFDVRLIAGGLLWLAFLFTSMLGLNRSLVHEKDQGCLDALLLSPVDRPVIFFAKATGNLVFLLIVEVLTLPLFWLMFLSGTGKQIAGPWWMIALALVVGSIGIAGMGTLFVPVMFPLLLGVVSATSAVILGDQGWVTTYWQMMGIAAGYDAIMLLAAFGLYEFVIGA